MGAVGLNFGSPTSGTGFDVSATVAEIVGNLQNVETPWKSQLTKLQDQDQTISNLGTLFSNLSNDLSSLTDFQGVMAQKEGSSSDQNVLMLTAANSTAVAGTHAVEVTSLAKTSSGYLAPVTSASAALTGSITLKVGANGSPRTIALNSSDNTLSGLASAINSSGVGITASVLTDSSGSRLSLVSGTSGANGNIFVTASSIAAYLNYTASTGTGSNYSTGFLDSIANAGDPLSGSLSIQVGVGTAENVVIGAAPDSPAANTIYTGSGVNTLSGLADAITNANIGVAASVVTNSDGSSSLKLVSGTAGTAGALTVNSAILDTNTSLLGYTAPVNGADAQLTVDGVGLTSASNTVANLIPGVTFQLLSPSTRESDGSLEQVQVVIANDNAGVESSFNSMVSDYNSLVSAINAQEGLDSSGNAEPLFGSPTLSLLQQQLLSGLNAQNPNGNLDSIATNTNTTLAGSISIAVGAGQAQTVTLDSSDNTIAGLASAINSAGIGVTATVVTAGTKSTLSLLSQTAGSAGTLTVNSSIVATGDTPLSFTAAAGSSTQTSTGALTAVSNAGNLLTGSVSIKVGTGTAQTVSLSSSGGTLSDLMNAINSANIGVTASIANNSIGLPVLSLLSGTAGSAGTLTLTSSILDTTNLSSANLNYTNSSDVSGIGNLGISVNNDGSITLDATSLDSILNSDYGGVTGFFQNANGWGQTFSNILTSAGTGSATGVLKLASTSNSNVESTLNESISKEDSLISVQQASLTAELTSANEIMQQLPSQLQGVDELYSAITGYNQNQGG